MPKVLCSTLLVTIEPGVTTFGGNLFLRISFDLLLIFQQQMIWVPTLPCDRRPKQNHAMGDADLRRICFKIYRSPHRPRRPTPQDVFDHGRCCQPRHGLWILPSTSIAQEPLVKGCQGFVSRVGTLSEEDQERGFVVKKARLTCKG